MNAPISTLLNIQGYPSTNFWDSLSMQLSPLWDFILWSLATLVTLSSQFHLLSSGSLLGSASVPCPTLTLCRGLENLKASCWDICKVHLVYFPSLRDHCVIWYLLYWKMFCVFCLVCFVFGPQVNVVSVTPSWLKQKLEVYFLISKHVVFF